MSKLCVFAGTREGRALIEALTGRGLSVTACVATEYGQIVLGEHPDVTVRAGALPRAEMPDFFRAEGFDLVVDATHPYAEHITESIRLACEETGIECIRLLRESTSDASDGVFVEDTEACIRFLSETTGNVLLTTGSKSLPQYGAVEELRPRLYARVLPMVSSLESCAAAGIAPDHIIAMQGPFDEELNVAMLRSVKAEWMVTKDTGSSGGYADKIAAAQRAGAKVVIIGRPPQMPGQTLSETLQLLERRFSLPAPKKHVFIVGIGMGSEDTRTLGLLRALRESEVVIGARRMVESVDTQGKRTFNYISAHDIIKCIQEDPARTFCILMSGDVGFYSGATMLVKLIDAEKIDVELMPGIGSLTYFCSRVCRPWQDVRAVSLHGRDCDFVREVRENEYVFTLLGGDTGARDAMQRLLDAGVGAQCYGWVGENLGYPEEKITQGPLTELMENEYSSLAVLLVRNKGTIGMVPATHGLPDEAFDRDKVPMTKEEVRSICVSKLALTRDAIVYDVGSGSGSVSVECARVANWGRVYAVEQKDTAIELTRHNAEKFSLTNLEVVPGTAPEALKPLPAPTHVFIGGSSGNLREIVDLLLAKNPDVRMVATAVTLETVAELTELIAEFEYTDIAEVQVNKPRKVGRYHLSNAQNPVYIFTFRKRLEPKE